MRMRSGRREPLRSQQPRAPRSPAYHTRPSLLKLKTRVRFLSNVRSIIPSGKMQFRSSLARSKAISLLKSAFP